MEDCAHLYEIVKRFVYILCEERDSLESIKKAFYDVSGDLNIGRIISDIPDSPNENEIRLLVENRVLFISDFGFDPEGSFDFRFATNSDSDGVTTVSPVPDHRFSEEEKDIITTLLKITDIEIGRCFALSEIKESSSRQVTTGLPNADGYIRRVAEKFSNNTIYNYDSYYFDLKGFGLINRRFGLSEGNKMLASYTRQLNRFFKYDEILGHLGGDNFVALVTAGERSKQFQDILLKGIDVEGETMEGETSKTRVYAVVGYNHIIPPITINRIIADPAMALAHAKRNKKQIVELTEDISYQSMRAKTIEQTFEKALNDDEFVVFYQPKVNSITNEIIGAEALTRWYENGQLIPPMAFIPVLENSGKINKLDLYVLEKVCKDIRNWLNQGHVAVPISINFSRKDLSDPDLPDKILNVINKYDLSKDLIIIEVTETASEEEKDHMVNFLGKLNENEIVTSIDDFGTGYSSLSVLREYPINEIKIDRSFINKKLNESDEIIIQSVIDMAKKLDIDVITEGVEIVEQKEFLHNAGCDRLQGFLYDKPLPREEFERRLLIGKYENI
jgi:EAL domain-containing protein (putative c-di-GMP-specific phosphodiesterase class I)